jgi:hypothetical protein
VPPDDRRRGPRAGAPEVDDREAAQQAKVRAGWESRFKSATGVRLDGLGSRIDGSVNPILDRYLRLKDAVTKRA